MDTFLSMFKNKTVLVLDFDGVLAVPYTNPEEPYKGVPQLIERLDQKGYILCMASYNPRAIEAVRNWGLSHCFFGMRAGFNDVWEGDYKEEYRTDMSKSRQIQSMTSILQNKKILFFDDDPVNVELVKKEIGCECILVDNKTGLTKEVLEKVGLQL